MTKVLVIYAKSGGGHLSLAVGVRDALQEYYPGKFQVEMCDPFPSIYPSLYQKSGSDFQKLFGQIYYQTDKSGIATVLHRLNNLLVGDKLAAAIVKSRPEIIITNNLLATIEIPHALKKSHRRAKIVIHFADPFTPHQLWFTLKNADLYLSPTSEVTSLAISSGIPPSKIKTVGWMVKKGFLKKYSSLPRLRAKLGLAPDRFTVFIGGAGQGGGKTLDISKLIAKNPLLRQKVQLVAVAGRNETLVKKLQKLSGQCPGFMYPFGFVENIPELMGASDLVVGKAGPNILFEAIFMNRPFVATGCLPGQEDGNLEFIKRENIGWVEEDPRQAVALIGKIVANQNLLTAKIANLARLRLQHQDAPRRLVTAIAKLAVG